MKHEDKQLFEQEMKDVRPLKRGPVPAPKAVREKPDPGTLYRRQAAQRHMMQTMHDSGVEVPSVLVK